jgi:HEAT repeat protein
MDHTDTLAAFVESLSSGDKKTIRVAVDALIPVALEQPEVNERLHGLLDETPAERRWPIAYVLAHTSPLTPACVAALKEMLGTGDPDLRWAAVVLLARLAREGGHSLVAELTGLLRSGSPTQRRMAVYCLRDILAEADRPHFFEPGGQAAFYDTKKQPVPVTVRQALIDALGDGDALVRVAVITSLKIMPQIGNEALDLLLRMFVEDTDMRVRASAALALARLGAGRSDVRAALEDASRSNDPILSKAARAALKILT